MIWGIPLQPSDQKLSLVDWRWKYSKDNWFAVDWCRTYDVNLNNYIFICTYEGLGSRCKWVKKEVSCFTFCNCVCIAARENIVGLYIYTYAEAYLEPSQTSTMELSLGENSIQLKIVNYIFKKADVWQGSKYASNVDVFSYF